MRYCDGRPARAAGIGFDIGVIPPVAQESDERARRRSASRAMLFMGISARAPRGRRLEPLVVGTVSPFGGHPGDDLIRIGDVAGLAVHAVRRVDLEPQAARLGL